MSGGLGQGAGREQTRVPSGTGNTYSEKGLPTEHAWPITVTPLRTCRQSASSRRVQFQLRQGEEFDTEAAHARPPHDGFEDGPSLTQEDSPSSAACLSRS
jgi:hypothetical protein